MNRFTFCLIFFCGFIWADESSQVVSRDGREVVLNQDGTWYFASKDILVDTPEGYTARLKPDGTWEYIGNAPLQLNDRHREQDMDIHLGEVFIYEEIKTAGGSKNTRRISSLNFEVVVQLSPMSSTAINLDDLNKNLFKVSDNRGKVYEIASISATPVSLEPGSSAKLMLVTKEAPSLLYSPNQLFLDIGSDALDTAESVRLTQIYGAVERKRN